MQVAQTPSPALPGYAIITASPKDNFRAVMTGASVDVDDDVRKAFTGYPDTNAGKFLPADDARIGAELANLDKLVANLLVAEMPEPTEPSRKEEIVGLMIEAGDDFPGFLAYDKSKAPQPLLDAAAAAAALQVKLEQFGTFKAGDE
jgi:hypothetical protein